VIPRNTSSETSLCFVGDDFNVSEACFGDGSRTARGSMDVTGPEFYYQLVFFVILI